MGNNNKYRKKKTFRHSTTFYRKLKQQTENARTKHYCSVVNKQPLPSIQKKYTNFQALLPSSIRAKSEPLVLVDDSEDDVTSCEEIENKIYFVEDSINNNGLCVNAEDFADVCDEEQRINFQISLSEQL